MASRGSEHEVGWSTTLGGEPKRVSTLMANSTDNLVADCDGVTMQSL